MPWFLAYNGQQIGPMDDAQARAQAQANPHGLAWRDGFAQWLPIQQVPELAPVMPPPGGMQPPPAPYGAASGNGGWGAGPAPGPEVSDEVDYKIVGSEMQFVEVELDPGESAVAEAGAMMYKTPCVEMDTLFGDGSKAAAQGGFMDKLLGAGKRLLTGESLFITVFTHRGQGKAHVAFGAPYPGNLIPVKLTDVGGMLICQRDSFLCAARGVSIGIYFQRKIMTGLFGGEGFIMQKLEGTGMVFMHAGGTIVERILQPGEVLHVDTGCVVAFEKTVQFDVQQAGNIKTALFGGEGLFFAVLSGPGKVWLQSLPFSRLAGRMLQAAPQRGGSKGEGSIVPNLGGFFGGDQDD
jgi:uncharacterized protein (TIGR00266 family)